MKSPTRSTPDPSAARAQPYVLLWLTGLSLRITLLAVPPLLLSIREEFGLTGLEVAALTTLPLLLFSVAATLGSAIVSALGARRTLIVGLVIAAAASALRGVVSSSAALFIFTFLMGLGIAAVQPAMPALVQSWIPRSVARATAVYVNGLLVAEAAGASLTLPLLLPALGSWQAALAVWTVPVVATLALVVGLTHDDPNASLDAGHWMPPWRRRLTWELGAVQAAGSVAYFASNAMLPIFLEAQQRGDLVGWSLSALNTSQLLASVVVGALPHAITARRLTLVLNGALIAAASIGVMLVPDLALLWSTLIGFGSAIVFTMSLALPAALASGRDVARLAAGMMTIGYGFAFLLPLTGGALVDGTGLSWTALSPVTVAGVAAMVVGAGAAHARHLGSESLEATFKGSRG